MSDYAKIAAAEAAWQAIGGLTQWCHHGNAQGLKKTAGQWAELS